LLATPVYGGLWRRAAASVVDGLVMFFPDAILRVLLDLPTLVTLRPVLESDVPRLMLVYAFETATWWLYMASMESSAWQGTLGQQLMGLRVTTVAGARVSFARASGRYFAQWLSVLICGMGYLFNLWTSRRQTLHDMIAGCVLVRRGLTAPAPRAPEGFAGGQAA
jgi:uncharacterized RDD family membrane protein YckC